MISVNSPLGTRQLLDLEVEVVLIFSSTEHRPSAGMKVSWVRERCSSVQRTERRNGIKEKVREEVFKFAYRAAVLIYDANIAFP